MIGRVRHVRGWQPIKFLGPRGKRRNPRRRHNPPRLYNRAIVKRDAKPISVPLHRAHLHPACIRHSLFLIPLSVLNKASSGTGCSNCAPVSALKWSSVNFPCGSAINEATQFDAETSLQACGPAKSSSPPQKRPRPGPAPSNAPRTTAHTVPPPQWPRQNPSPAIPPLSNNFY